MFNIRFGYYLCALSVFVIIIMYDGIKNTLFRKNNTRCYIVVGIICIVLNTLPAIF